MRRRLVHERLRKGKAAAQLTPARPPTHLGSLNSHTRRLEGLAYFSVICLAVQFAGVLSGTSFFFPALNAFQVIAHFMGTILVGLFASQGWPIGTYSWCFIIFGLLPALSEAFVALAVFRFRVLDYAG